MKEKINFEPMNDQILVYAPVISETTDAGIIKSEIQLEEEKKNMDKFLTVALVSESITNIKAGDKILVGSGNHKGVELEGVMYMLIHKLSILGKRITV